MKDPTKEQLEENSAEISTAKNSKRKKALRALARFGFVYVAVEVLRNEWIELVGENVELRETVDKLTNLHGETRARVFEIETVLEAVGVVGAAKLQGTDIPADDKQAPQGPSERG